MSLALCSKQHQWLNRANNAAILQEALSSRDVYNAIEIDLSHVRGNVQLAHHKDDSGVDTTLSRFLRMLEQTTNTFIIKFDFKDIRSVTEGITLIASSSISQYHCIICNVDGLQGPAGRSEVLMCARCFEALVNEKIPSSQVSIGMTTAWHVSTLFFSHGYSMHQARVLAGMSNVTSSLRMTILAQTRPHVVSVLLHNRNVLVRGEVGFFENAWLSSEKTHCIDRYIWGPGWWVFAQYTWLVAILLLCCILIYFFWCRDKKVITYQKI